MSLGESKWIVAYANCCCLVLRTDFKRVATAQFGRLFTVVWMAAAALQVLQVLGKDIY
jgi:hypothetical protein